MKMEERTVKIKQFFWDEEFESAGSKGWTRRTARRGDTVELPKDVIEYGESMGAFVTDEDVAAEEAASVDVAEMDQEELVDWVSEATIPEIINVAQNDPTLAKPLLEAENTATGNDPRGGLTEALADLAGEGEGGAEETEEVDVTQGAVDLADAESVNLEEVEGTGKEGRITKGDVEQFIQVREDEAAAAEAAAAESAAE